MNYPYNFFIIWIYRKQKVSILSTFQRFLIFLERENMFSGEKLKALRESRNISVASLAKEFGCSRQYIHKLEQSTTPPSRKMMEKYSLFFDVSTDYLIGNNNEVNSITVYTLANSQLHLQSMRLPLSFFEDGKQYFALSLQPTELIICEKAEEILYQRPGVFRYQDKNFYGYLRKFSDGTIWLISLRHKPRTVILEEVTPLGYASYQLQPVPVSLE